MLQNNYAFVEFENEEDAAKAKEELQDKDMSGLKINIGKKKTSVVGVASAGTKVNKKPANTARTSTSMDAAASSRLNSARYPVP